MTEANRGLPTAGNEISPFDLLSPREQEIMQLVADGYSSYDISESLCIARKTVERHKQNISHLGTSDKRVNWGDNNRYVKDVLLALVQDGINYDYISHSIPDNLQMKALTPLENSILER